MYWQNKKQRNVTHAQSRRHIRCRRAAFTLVELMVVIVILGLLSGVVTMSVRSYLIRSKQNVAKMEISKICQALETFYTTYDRYPKNQEGLPVLSQPSDEFAEGILTFVPSDPWGHPYEYVSPGKTKPYDVSCYGADHREGGTAADKDITSNELGQRSRGG
ncbi:Type II secretion system protein G precursor [Rubripirellula lacrimiformis]|uniref:Type II secretion system protein G n=1 Tax=Rubripirellula lacrimiformis TaxID=1930273 RepID=A0A517NK49_9BACT|nr:type II secretion system major pseudopilin GspG [Rubripirellula lacrimiformis]QDT07413.1 Type II secretion system protein G precursor [Rubripirellula lacrimiformis]